MHRMSAVLAVVLGFFVGLVTLTHSTDITHEKGTYRIGAAFGGAVEEPGGTLTDPI
jgi:hypothetical protein